MRRVVRRIDVVSVLKVSSLLFVTFTLVLLVAGVILWFAGTVLGFDDFRFVGPQLLRGFVAAGLVLVLVGTGFCVFVATVYNLIADVVGGVQFVVLEEDTRPRPAASTSTSKASTSSTEAPTGTPSLPRPAAEVSATDGYPDPAAQRARGYSSAG